MKDTKSDDYNIDLEEEIPSNSNESFDIDTLETEENEKQLSSKPINKSMMIAEIIDTHPELVPMIMDYGVHCIGCGGAMFETLEEGLMGHGIPDDEIDRMIDELNDFIKRNSKKE